MFQFPVSGGQPLTNNPPLTKSKMKLKIKVLEIRHFTTKTGREAWMIVSEIPNTFGGVWSTVRISGFLNAAPAFAAGAEINATWVSFDAREGRGTVEVVAG